jgi:hypothetical protein
MAVGFRVRRIVGRAGIFCKWCFGLQTGRQCVERKKQRMGSGIAGWGLVILRFMPMITTTNRNAKTARDFFKTPVVSGPRCIAGEAREVFLQ